MAHLNGEAKVLYVRDLFSRISERYDLLNSFMTARMHYRWKTVTANMATKQIEGRALDVATGTGDIAFRLARRPGITQTIGIDFAPPMLAIAQRRAKVRRTGNPITFVMGDALALPLPDASFNCVTTGFSLRNVASTTKMLQEMHRVLITGGRLCILEATPVEPRGLFRRILRLYLHKIVPVIGSVLARDREAYTYLPTSMDQFLKPEELSNEIRNAGFTNVSYRKVGFGTVAIHVAVKA